MNVSDLKPAGYNPRKITEKKLSMLAKSMSEYGDLSGIIFNRRTGRLFGGHQRYKNLKSTWPVVKYDYADDVGTVAIGYIETPHGRWNYREVDWPEKKEMAANIAANQHGGEFDYPKLKDIIVEIDDGQFNIELAGFECEEVKNIFDYEPKQTLDTQTPVSDAKTLIVIAYCKDNAEQL